MTPPPEGRTALDFAREAVVASFRAAVAALDSRAGTKYSETTIDIFRDQLLAFEMLAKEEADKPLRDAVKRILDMKPIPRDEPRQSLAEALLPIQWRK